MRALRAGLRGYLAAVIALTASLLTHEIVTFGYLWGFWTGAADPPPFHKPGTGLEMALEQLLVNGMIALPLLPLTALVAWVGRGAAVPTLAFAALWFWGAEATARGHAIYFGNTWRFGEAARELLFHPLLTPILWICATLAFHWLSRSRATVPSGPR